MTYIMATPDPTDLSADDARYHHLLSTNDEPLSEEIPEIRKVVERHKVALARLEAQIVEIQAMLDTLIAYRNRETARLCQYRGVLSPIRRLPRDILIEIFLSTREWTSDSDLGYINRGLEPILVGPHPGPSPLLIIHVCSEWRNIALGIPMLWATVKTFHDLNLPPMTTHDIVHDRRETWLARTGSVSPLDITVRTSSIWCMKAYAKCPASLSWMQPYVHRIRTLSLHGAFASFPNGSYDALELLLIQSDAYFHDNESAISMPSLRRLLLCGYIELLQFIPWAQLTHLVINIDVPPGLPTVTVTGPSPLLSILSQCLALEHLDLKVKRDGEHSAGEDRLLIPRLQTLIVYYHLGEDSSVDWLLSYLTLPALVKLDISFNNWPRSVFDAFQSRSLFALKSLTLHGEGIRRVPLRIEEADLFNVIGKAPCLTDIILNYSCPITSTLISGFRACSGNGSPLVAPNLEYLALYPGYSGKDLDTAILDMLTSRDPSANPGVPTIDAGARAVFISHLPKRACHSNLDSIMGISSLHIYF